MRPSFIRIRRSKRLKIYEFGWWMEHATVRPSSHCVFSNRTRLSAVKESRPLVGSSSSNTLGLVISSKPMEVRFFSPPESPFRNTLPTKVS